MDLNNTDQLEKLDKAVRSDQGQLIINYFLSNLKDLEAKRDAIDLTLEDKVAGQEFKRLETARRELDKIINFLISRYENSSQE